MTLPDHSWMLERLMVGLLTSPPLKPPVRVWVTSTAAPPTKELHMSAEQPYFCHKVGSLNLVRTLSSTCVLPYCTCIVVVGLKTCIQLTPYCCEGSCEEVKRVGRVLGAVWFQSMPA